MSIESSYAIAKRIAGIDHPMTFVDAAGHPIGANPTLRTDGQIYEGDFAAATSGGPEPKTADASATTGMKGMAHAAMQAISSVTGGKDTDSAPGPIMTSNFGFPMQDPTHCYNINGHPLVSDTTFMEKQQTFNRAKIIERPVHACGSGAFGYFEVTNDLSHLCKAKFMDKVGKKTPMFSRFSTVTYGREFPDSARNPRGLAWKLYTEDGNYDILTVNFPSFFVRDPTMGPDLIRSQQRNPSNFQVNLDSTFDFMSLVPESQLTNLWFWSDHGHPVGWRFMDSYPIHTFRWVNAKNEGVWVRYKITSDAGIKNFTWPEAVKMCGEDPDFAKRDLWQWIDDGNEATWTWSVQVMTDEQANSYYVDPFDATKRWNDKDFPPQVLGKIHINRNPENYHRDVEQSAFSPGRIVLGIEPSPDALLQARLWFYNDAQYNRLGVNYHQIPVNCPFMAKSYHPPNRDGAMRVDSNGGAEAHYFPNSFSHPPPPMPANEYANWTVKHVQGVLGRQSHSRSSKNPKEEYIQATEFFEQDLSDSEKAHLISNIATGLARVTRLDIKVRFLICMYKVSAALANGILTQLQTIDKKASPITCDKIADLANSVPHASDPNNSYAPMPISL